MYWINRIPEIREVISEWTKDGATIGLVPTMGYFHEGHLALMEKARQENDYVWFRFCQPDQFGPNEDFQRYPRDEERDRELAEKPELIWF